MEGQDKKFWKPGTVAPGVDIDRIDNDNNELGFIQKYNNIDNTRLPVYIKKKEFLHAVMNNQIIICIGEPGSGKNTQLCQYLYEANFTGAFSNHNNNNNYHRSIVSSELSSFIAASLADYVAKEMNVKLGTTVGYSISYYDLYNTSTTHIKYVTNSLLLREIYFDPLLSKYSVILLDEVHVRTLDQDLLMCLLNKILQKRLDLKLIILTSALLEDKNINLLLQFYKNFKTRCITFNQPRVYSVDIFYTKKPVQNYIISCVELVLYIHNNNDIHNNDIIIFLPTVSDIFTMKNLLRNNQQNNLIIITLHSHTSKSERIKLFYKNQTNLRKLILTTSVSENSLTFPTVSHVIDTGLTSEIYFNPINSMRTSKIIHISKNIAYQRAGRIGRNRAGRCYRLYTNNMYNIFEKNNLPCIQRLELTEFILSLLSVGINNILKFNFLSKPPVLLLSHGIETLFCLNIIDKNGQLTSYGKLSSFFPSMKVNLIIILLTASKYNILQLAIDLVSMLSVQHPYVSSITASKKNSMKECKQRYVNRFSDHLTLMNVLKCYNTCYEDKDVYCNENYLNSFVLQRANNIRLSLERICTNINLYNNNDDDNDDDNDKQDEIVKLRKCICSGYFMNAAQLDDSTYTYKLAKDGNNPNRYKIHNSSIFYGKRLPRWIVFHEILSIDNEYYLKDVTEIEARWLTQIAPYYYNYSSINNAKKQKYNQNKTHRHIF